MKKSLHISFLLFISLLLSISASAKDIKINGNNTPYATEEIQKLASTAVKMGVSEPVSLNLLSGNLTVSGSNKTSCIIKVGEAKTPKISGISCK